MARLGVLAVLLLLSRVPSSLQADEYPVEETLKQHVTDLLKTMLGSFSSNDVPDPRVLLALRLADQHNLAIERAMVQRLKEDAVNRVQNNLNFTTGTVALYVMALQASCENASAVSALGSTINLFQLLREKYQEELDYMNSRPKKSNEIGFTEDDERQPITNFYQVSLGILALCLQDANVFTIDTYYVDRAACSPSERITEFSVDAAAIAVLYMVCRHHNIDAERKMILQASINCIMDKMSSMVTKDAAIGNIYSTGIAMQALLAAEKYINMSRWNTTAIRAAVLGAISEGRFANPLAASQITIPLMGLTYLNVSNRNCSTDQDNLPLDYSQRPPPNSNLRLIKVSFRALDDVYNTFNYSIDLTVPEGSTFLKVMETAQIYRPDEFSFRTDFSTRLYIYSINGLFSKYSDMTFHPYWKMYTREGGLDEYIVSEGEKLLAHFKLW